jgi:leucyl-tRNA synthetase
MVLAPEHSFVLAHIDSAENKEDIVRYIALVKGKTEIDRTSEGKEKTGIELSGVMAINPATKKQIPIWIADYVLPHYGTGAIMAVPSDDERDHEFASKFGLPIVTDYPKANTEDFGKKVIRFKLRDWVFSRQRYWGEPIPVVHCDNCGIVPVPEKDLPVVLPDVEKYEPTDTGESPLAVMESWVNTKCPKCGGQARRETDTMPNWAGSSWYFLRYTDPHNNEIFASEGALKHWMPVDWYNGGMEHTTLHLLYSRFWNKFFFDIGLVPTSEPCKKRTSHGLVLAEGGEKMSKSKGNVVNPDTIVAQFGADTLRVYEMFMGPFEQAIAWNEESLVGPRRFIERVWKLFNSVNSEVVVSTEEERVMNETIKKVSCDIEELGFNTAISALMMYTNALEKKEKVSREEYSVLLKLLAPFAPHITEELWNTLGEKGSIHNASWPTVDEAKLKKSTYTYAVQVQGKVRATFEMSAQAGEEEVKVAALALPEVEKWLNGAFPKKVIVVLGRIVNIVV